MNDLTHTPLPNRGLLRVSGDEAESFLQSLVSNDISKAAEDQAIYATLLTPQGKFLHDFFVVRDAEGFLIDCEADRLSDLKRRLTMYKLRSKVDLVDETAQWQVLAGSVGEPVGGFIFEDPRHPELGQRAILPVGHTPATGTADFSVWDDKRISLGIPDGSRDIEIEKSFLLEHRMDEWNAIDFKKGCYVGQELTARTKYRGNVRKRLTTVTVHGPLPETGTPVLVEGVEVGTVRTGINDRALAILRIELPKGELEAGEARLTVT